MTDSATVTTVEPMDDNRPEQVVGRVAELLREYGSDERTERVEKDGAPHLLGRTV